MNLIYWAPSRNPLFSTFVSYQRFGHAAFGKSLDLVTSANPAMLFACLQSLILRLLKFEEYRYNLE